MSVFRFERFRRHCLPLILILASAFAIYATTFDHLFLANLDDNAYVLENEAIRGFSIDHVRSAFTTFYAGNYAPLQILSYMLDYRIWGMRAGGFLVTNTLFHALNGCLFYLLLVRLYCRRLWALPAALLFIVHPLQVESVAWISQRKTVLAMFFFLLAWLWHLSYQERGWRRGRACYAASLAAFSLALLSKSVVVILPVILLLRAIMTHDRTVMRKGVVETFPHWVAAAACGILTLLSQDPAQGGGRSVDYWGGSPLATLFTMLPVLVSYLAMIVRPLQLALAYEQPLKSIADLQVIRSALLLALLVGGVALLYRRQRELSFWGMVFFIGLLPVSQIVPLVTLMNDRYLYFPLLGVAAIAGGLATHAVDRCAPPWRRWACALLFLLLLPPAVLAQRKATVWKDSITVWRDSVVNEPRAAMNWLGLGGALLYYGHLPQARDALLTAYRLFPQDEDILLNLGRVYNSLNMPLTGRPYLEALMAANPDNSSGLISLAESYRREGNLPGSAQTYRRALLLQPASETILKVYRDMGQYDLANDCFRRAAASAPP